MHLSETGRVTIHGIDYKDRPDDGARWLDTDWAIRIDVPAPTWTGGWRSTGEFYGVPETYVIDPAGRIAFKQIGPITPEILNQTICPWPACNRKPPTCPLISADK